MFKMLLAWLPETNIYSLLPVLPHNNAGTSWPKKWKLMALCTLTEDRCLAKNKYMGEVHFIVPAAVMMRGKKEDNWIKSTSTWIVKSIQWRPERWINEHNYRTHPLREDTHQYQIHPQRTDWQNKRWTEQLSGI
jgi:hypothetical protein